MMKQQTFLAVRRMGLATLVSLGMTDAMASVEAVPGEAQLIPLFYYHTHDSLLGQVDTEVRITVPQSVGVDEVLSLTTPHVDHPPFESDLNPVLNVAAAPGKSNLDSSINAFYINADGTIISNRTYAVSVDDVVLIKASDLMPNGRLGYMIITTKSGSAGKNANFAFSAEAWLVNRSAAGDAKNPWAVRIPTFAMSDAADSPGDAWPTGDNNVVELFSATGNARGINAAPIISGIRTTAADSMTSLRVIDLALAEPAQGTDSALLVFWNEGKLAIQQRSGSGFVKWFLPQPAATAGQNGRGAVAAFSILLAAVDDGGLQKMVPKLSILAHDRGRFLGR